MNTPLVQNNVSPAARGWGGLPWWGKIAVVSGLLAVTFAAFIIPDLLGRSVAEEPDRERRTPQRAEPFRQPVAPDDPVTGSASGGGQREEPRRRRAIPPPIAISSFAPPPATSRTAQDDVRGARGGMADGETGAGSGAPGGMGGGGGDSSRTSLAGQMTGRMNMPTMQGRFLRDSDFIITSHTAIPCRAVGAINSALGGLVTCTTAEWIRGTTQRRGILPPGSIIKGQIRDGMSQGQERLGVLYTQIETSGDRYQINLTGLAADEMGRNGLTGDVRTFFWETAGAVALYALIDGGTNLLSGVGQSAANRALGTERSGGGVNFSAGGENLAGQALRHRLNREPELERAPALPQFVVLAGDLDFAAVCRDRARFNQNACPEM